MKLIEINDNNSPSYVNNNINVDDENYSKPRVLSTLDNIMNEILNKPISDSDKWQLYSQALQRYLNHVKYGTQKNNYVPTSPEKIKNDTTAIGDAFNFSMPQFDISGVQPIRDSLDSISQPIRDSLDSISQPAVRQFFENARKSNDGITQSPPLLPLPDPMDISNRQNQITPKKSRAKRRSNPRRVLPYQPRTRAVASKRRAENSLLADSQIRPCKVMLKRLNWEPTSAR